MNLSNFIEIRYRGLIPTMAVFSLIISSGANMFLRKIHIFAAITILIALYYRRINKKALFAGISVISFIIIDSIFFNTANTDYKELVLLIIRIVGCVTIVSNITENQFKQYFLSIIVVLSIISLVCFGLICIGVNLPGSTTINNSYGTFYHVYSFGIEDIYRRYRNCGIFTEPGIYQIYINMALLILLSMRKMSIRKLRYIFLLLTVTLISTKSSMGYLIYGIVLILYLIYRPEVFFNVKIKKKHMLILILFGMVIVLGEELSFGVITNFVKNTNSYASRHDDTLLTFLIARDYPIWGIGLATDPIPIWDQYYMRFEALRLYRSYQNAMSCGLGNYLCMGGIPFTVIYILSLIRMVYRMINQQSKIMLCGVSVIIILFLLEEPLLPTPFFYMGIVSALTWKWETSTNRKEKLFAGEHK